MPFTIEASRRQFLVGVAAAAGGLALPLRAGAQDAASAAPWLALLSDVHIAADPAATARGQRMADNFRAAVAGVLGQGSKPNAVVIDGDLALKEGLEGDYRTLLDRLAPIRDAGVPLHLALGNHDDRGPFRRAFADAARPAGDALVEGRHLTVVEDAAGLRLVVLDSLITPNAVPGRLDPDQRGWLARTLDARPDAATVVFVHHNPAVGNLGALLDAQELLDLVDPRRQVKAVVFGHTHVWDVADRNGLYLVNLPAVAYPFDAAQPIGWCRLTPNAAGATLDLMPLAQAAPRETRTLRWRA